MTRKALIYIELDNNKPAKVSQEILSHVLCCFDETDVYGVVVSDEKQINCALNELKSLGLNKLFILQDSLFDEFNPCTFSTALASLVTDINPDVMLMGATCNGRELAPRLASKLNIGLTADCTDLQLDNDGKLLATRPTYGGKMMATIISKTMPNFATIRPGAFKLQHAKLLNETELIYISSGVEGLKSLIEIIHTEHKPPVEDWTCAEIIIAGGLGLKTKDNFDLIYKLCELIDARPAASRAAVEQGWANPNIQVGQTGSSVSPKLYIALGISGALQHMAGITNADKIIAINTDKSAPIMFNADVAINSDAESVLRSMIEKFS